MKKSWKDISIGDYYQIQEIMNDTTLDNMDREMSLFALLYDITLEEAYNTPVNVFAQKMGKLTWVWEKPKPEVVADTYSINGVKYKTLLAPDTMTTAQYIDFKNTLPGCEDHLEQMLSIFLVPEGKEYNTNYDIKQVEADILEYFPITSCMGLCAFFLIWSRAWTEVLTDYSRKMLKTAMRKEKDPRKKQLLKEQLMVMSGFRSLMRSPK